MPTFQRILDRHPDAQLKWFSRGRLWESPESAKRARARTRERRHPGWRPGGEHCDPRQRFKDAKAQQNQARRRRRWEQKRKPSSDDRSVRAAPSPSRPGAGHPPRPSRRKASQAPDSRTFVPARFARASDTRQPIGSKNLKPEGEPPRATARARSRTDRNRRPVDRPPHRSTRKQRRP